MASSKAKTGKDGEAKRKPKPRAANLQPPPNVPRGTKKRLKPGPKAIDTGDALGDMLAMATMIQKASFEKWGVAHKNNLVTVSGLMEIHTRSWRARMEAETAYRAELERRGVLVNKATILAKARHAVETMLRLLKKLPTQCGPECNPHEALKATRIIERSVAEILKAGEEGVRALG